MASECSLVVVMPIYNEEANIANVLTEWIEVFEKLDLRFEILAINDGSKDSTLDVLSRFAQKRGRHITVCDKPNSGHGRACRYGYELAIQRSAIWVFQIDSDGQCDPVFFDSFWQSTSEADCIFGIRTTRGDGFARALTSKLCQAATSLAVGMNVKDPNVPYRLIRREALECALSKVPADFDVQNVALTVALKREASLRWKYLPIHFRDRQGGSNSINLRSVARMGLNMLKNLRSMKR